MQPRFCLTDKDRSVLQALQRGDRWLSSAKRALLAEKLRHATIVHPDEIRPSIATLNSRVRYRVDEGPVETDRLSSQSHAPGFGLFLPLDTLRALALLGLEEGQEFTFHADGGQRQTVVLEQVCYQPESARRANALG